jgi:hypothetical protein
MWSFDVVFIILAIALPVVVVGQSTTFCNISQAEYDALEALYVSCSGDNWLWDPLHPEQKWIFPSSLDKPCLYSWQGLTCSSTALFECSVSAVNLASTNLVGTLPTAIGNLTALRNLNLNLNSIYGSLPDSIGNWQAMQSFEISYTSLGGSLPSGLYSWSSAKTISLVYNQFSGEEIFFFCLECHCCLVFQELCQMLLETCQAL